MNVIYLSIYNAYFLDFNPPCPAIDITYNSIFKYFNALEWILFSINLKCWPMAFFSDKNSVSHDLQMSTACALRIGFQIGC